jgi:hypothetical protein
MSAFPVFLAWPAAVSTLTISCPSALRAFVSLKANWPCLLPPWPRHNLPFVRESCRSVLKDVVMPRARYEVPCPTFFHALSDLLHKGKLALYPPFYPFRSSFSPRLGNMNPSMSSHYPSSFISFTPDPVSSTALQTPSPFNASTRAPNSPYLPRSTRWPGAQGPSYVQSSPSPTNTTPSISVQREAQAQASSFQANDLSLSRQTSGPAVNYQSRASLSPYPQHPPFLCNDSFGTDLKEKLERPPRPSNAFILFRSDLLKRKFIFKGQETRQHKLSIIAAKCWDKLTREEKKKWFLEAEREKKAHAIKYADYRSRSRSLSRGACARSRDESRLMASPSCRDLEKERLGRLADMAYKEIINDVPSQLERESTFSPSPCMTAVLASCTPTPPPRVQWNGDDAFTLDCYREQGQPSPRPPLAFSSPAAGEERHLSLTMNSASDFSTFQDARMFPTVSHFTASFPSPDTASHRIFIFGYPGWFCWHAVSCDYCSTCLFSDARGCE